ncbi:MAG: NADH-quinone oxidoreductase subunit J [Pseudomonadota bacterium]
MSIEAFAFYLFASVAVLSGLMVILQKNPVHCVLYLILAFFSAGGLFVLLGAEFLAMILVIVYVGAVAVLFLFVVMMLDIDFAALRAGYAQYLPFGLVLGLILALQLALVGFNWEPGFGASSLTQSPVPQDVTNTEAIGDILYTDYFFAFHAAAMILLVAMIGAVVLTLRSREGVKRQDVAAQNARTAKDAIEVIKVPSGEGI